ncbi:MAG: TIGR00730 family Rossman fold protein [Alphaproteobacteria bacterium PRO2]|nr:TIGR00730 family Rossman fold protein [Alphaproteobacteria bacterium PRO2]
MKNICVFCGSSTAVDEKYLSAGRDVGVMLARNGYGVVYGGSNIGLMGAVADAALERGGKVIGVIPKFLKDQEVAHTGLTELHLTDTMHERQVGMAVRADAFVILPGGLGTLAEFFEVLTWKQLGLHDKPIMLVNVFGYWDSLMNFAGHAEGEKFLRPQDARLYTVLADAGALETHLKRL